MTSKNDIEYKAVKRLKKNDSKAFEYLFHTYYDQVHGFVMSTLFDKTFAEDITQSVFVTLWEQRKSIDPDKKLSSFLYTIARNKVYRQTERLILQKKHQEYLGDNNISDLDIVDEVNSLFLKKIITDLIEELPDRATVKETYEQAINDLKKSIELFSINNGPIFGSANAAKALLSRIYLYMSGTYETPNAEYANLAIKYADEVINSPDYSLLPRSEFMNYNRKTPESNKETIFAIKRVASEFSGYDHYYGVGGMYGVIGGMGWGEMYASAKYIDLLNETGRNDWYKNKIVDARAAFIAPQYVEQEESVFRFIKNVYPLQKGTSVGNNSNYNYVQAKVINKNGELYCVESQIQYEYQGDKIVARKGADDKTLTKDVEYKLTPISESEGTYKIESYNTFIDIEPIIITVTGVIDNRMKLNRIYPMFYITKASREGEESHLHSPVITRLGEVYLNKAEALAKVGRYGEALTALNIIRERSLPGKGYATLNATNAGELIDKERQLELAYQAERSYDVFRNGKSLNRMYPGPHNAMEIVKATDYRVVYYIPQDAINSYPGTLTQNPTN